MKRVTIDPSELIDFRSMDAPLALWKNRTVLGVCHDGAIDMPQEWKISTERLVHEALCILDVGIPTVITHEADFWAAQNWIATPPGQC